MSESIHITIQGSPDDPRMPREIPEGVVVHYSPPLHPEEVTVIDGIPVTSVARTLVDVSEEFTRDELRDAFAKAGELGILDMDAVLRSRGRVEWRASLAMLDEVIAEFLA
jgi:hypothetical protein